MEPPNEIHPTLPAHIKLEHDDFKLMHRAQDPSYTGMKTYKKEEKDRMPWTQEHINLAEGHQGFKRIHYDNSAEKS